MKGLFHGTGPCSVNADSKSTTLNSHSWNNEANMLYIDQPVQTGFSYDVLVNVTSTIMGKTNLAMGASQNAFQTANSTGNAARATWRFLQVFLADFPEFKSKTNALSIWSTDYGGRWAPSFAAHFLRQSEKKVVNEIPLKIETIGIVNGLYESY
jgi:carboxypeptidase C (cathepsin A)